MSYQGHLAEVSLLCNRKAYELLKWKYAFRRNGPTTVLCHKPWLSKRNLLCKTPKVYGDRQRVVQVQLIIARKRRDHSKHLGVRKVVPMLIFNWAPRHEGVLGEWGIAPHILDLGTSWRWVDSFTLRQLYPQGKIPWYPLDRRLGGPQSCSGCGGEEKTSHPHRELNPRNPFVQPVA
jgi:hypothetical protein